MNTWIPKETMEIPEKTTVAVSRNLSKGKLDEPKNTINSEVSEKLATPIYQAPLHQQKLELCQVDNYHRSPDQSKIVRVSINKKGVRQVGQYIDFQRI
jgi:hypothetical protein